MTCARVISAVCIFAGCAADSLAAAPTIFSESAHQSPVRGDPDDLLLLPGHGFGSDDVVVYRALDDATQPLAPPDQPPQTSTDRTGIVPVVGTASVPHALVVKLPGTMRSGQMYGLWVRTRGGEWSNGIRINDPRPLWITPAYVHASAPLASLPRSMKVVGRNLQPAPGTKTRVRLLGPASFALTASADDDPSTAIERYVAEVELPERMPAGEYSVEVSRDGASWVELPAQRLAVRADPPPLEPFAIEDYGGCRPDDDEDDTACVVKAIAAATAAGGGAIAFGPGGWHLADSAVRGVDHDGIVVPHGVDLRGAGAARTRIARGQNWRVSAGNALFALQGRNRVSGITFEDARRYTRADAQAPILQLGISFYRMDRRPPHAPPSVDDVVITHNVFTKTSVAIGDGGLPVRRLFVTHNELGAYHVALFPGGNRYNVQDAFTIEDSVVAHNTFAPGSYTDVAAEHGTMASALGAARRLDFSRNVAAGTSTTHLYSTDEARGWRAAFFWHLTGNHELLLVSQNTVTCAGDRSGDGAAIAFDNNANTFAFESARTVLEVTRDGVTIEGRLEARQNDRDVDVARYYAGHWLQVVEGPGLGQARRIDSYTIDAAATRVTFRVTPAWDVAPHPGLTRILVGREYWQAYVVDNLVDHRKPPCLKSNRNGPAGGVISFYAQSSDSVIEGNRQFDSDGILVQQSYSARDPACAFCTPWSFVQSFLEVRGNRIDGEYEWESDCSQSGISLMHSAAPTPASPPPTASYGMSISHNRIRRADGLRGGAITFPVAWYEGPPPHDWPVVVGPLVHHNVIDDLAGPAPRRKCDGPRERRTGIQLASRLVHGAVLYANRCRNVALALAEGARNTRRLCPSPVEESCECRR